MRIDKIKRVRKVLEMMPLRLNLLLVLSLRRKCHIVLRHFIFWIPRVTFLALKTGTNNEFFKKALGEIPVEIKKQALIFPSDESREEIAKFLNALKLGRRVAKWIS